LLRSLLLLAHFVWSPCVIVQEAEGAKAAEPEADEPEADEPDTSDNDVLKAQMHSWRTLSEEKVKEIADLKTQHASQVRLLNLACTEAVVHASHALSIGS
jgi:hypothetical protein